MTARGGDAAPSGPPVVIQEGLQGKCAGFASRLTAFAVDVGISLGVFMLALAAVSFAARVLTGKDIAWNRGDIWVIIAYAVWAFIYFAYSWAASGRTAGMALFGVRVVRDDGTDASGRRAVVRTLALPLSFLFLGLGFAGILAGRPTPGAARRHRRDGGHLLLGRAGGAAAVPVPGLILQQAGGSGRGEFAGILEPSISVTQSYPRDPGRDSERGQPSGDLGNELMPGLNTATITRDNDGGRGSRHHRGEPLESENQRECCDAERHCGPVPLTDVGHHRAKLLERVARPRMDAEQFAKLSHDDLDSHAGDEPAITALDMKLAIQPIRASPATRKTTPVAIASAAVTFRAAA